MASDDLHFYQELLRQYRRHVERVRLLFKRARIDYTIEDKVIKADIARNECHNELTAVGSRLGKAISDVTLDIISLDENLSEYNLPEFRLMLLDDVFEPHEGQALSLISFEKEYLAMHYNAVVSNKERKRRSFIPFVAEESWALSEDEGHFDRMPDALERRRRAELLSDSLGGVELVVLEIPGVINAAERIIGLMVEPDDSEKVLHHLYENRRDFSIDPAYMPRMQIKKDWMAIIFDDIYTLTGDDEHDFSEHALVLLERYKKRIVKMRIDATYKEMAIPAIDREIVAEEIDKEYDHFDLDREYQKLEVLLKHEGMKRQ